MREEILQLIIENAAVIFGVSKDELSESTTFASLDAKSANFVQLSAAIEDEYEAEIPFMKFRKCATLGEAADFTVDVLE